MEFPRGESEALYRGHISGRRLRGIKINPIYQENDVGGNGALDDTQSDNSILVGEIQIDLYESLPRQRKIRQYNSDPMLLNSGMDNSYRCSGREGPEGAGTPAGDETTFSHLAFPPSSNSKITNEALSVPSKQPMPSSDATNDDVLGSPERSLSEVSTSSTLPRRQVGGCLVRQSRIGGVSDLLEDDDGTANKTSGVYDSEKVEDILHPSTSSPLPYKCLANSTVTTTTNGQSSSENDVCRASVQEINEIFDEMVAEIEALELVQEGGECDRDSSLRRSEPNCARLPVTLSESDVKCLDFKRLNGDKYHTTEEISSDTSHVGYVLQRSPAYYCLDAIAKLPTYSDLHYIGSISPTDYINNNNVTIPDQMLIIPKTPSNSKDEKPFSEADAFKVVHSLSNGSSIEMEFNPKCNVSVKDGTEVKECSCGGRPSLKCACGRLALQKLLKQKNMVVEGEAGNEIRLYSTISDGSSTPEIVRNKTNSKAFGKSKPSGDTPKIHSDSNPENCNDSGITQISSSIQNQNDSTPQHEKISKHDVNKTDTRMVTFANDTIFNEFQCKSKNGEDDMLFSPEHHDYLNGEYYGEDNPVFVCDEDGVLYEIGVDYNHKDVQWSRHGEFGERGTRKHPRAKNNLQGNEPVQLNANDLNAPHYLESYLQSINGSDDTTSTKKAAPVSIEAIGGTVFAGHDLITEASEEEFEYYRRRRKHKYDDYTAEDWIRKMDRPKKIKIGVAVFVVVALIITGIALGIHYGVSASNSTTTSSDALTQDTSLGGYIAPF